MHGIFNFESNIIEIRLLSQKIISNDMLRRSQKSYLSPTSSLFICDEKKEQVQYRIIYSIQNNHQDND